MTTGASSSLTGSDILDELVAVIGFDAMVKLLTAYGGRRVDVRLNYEPESPMVAAIGVEAAAKLSEYFHGSRINLPMRLAREIRVRALAAQEPRLTRDQIAAEVGIGERGVRKMLNREPQPLAKRAGLSAAAADPQPDMFGFRNSFR